MPNNLNPDGGTPLVTTGTFGSVVLALLTFYLPWLLTHAGIPVANQGPFVAFVNQVGPPLFALLTLFFRHSATQKVTSVLPRKGMTKTALHALLIFPLLIIVGAGALFLSACASLSTNTQASLLVAEIGAETSFVATAEGAKTFEALSTTTPAQAAVANGDACKAWALLAQARTAYGLGQTFLPIITELSDLQQQAAQDTSGKTTAPSAVTMRAKMRLRSPHTDSIGIGDISLVISILQDVIAAGNALVTDLPQLISIVENTINASKSGDLTSLQAEQAQVQTLANSLQPTGC